jgi:hypothetical protein
MGAYNRSDFEHADIYARTCVAVLRQYPDMVVESITDPATGIQTKAAYPPKVAELRAACERSYTSFLAIKKHQMRKETAAERAALAEKEYVDRSRRPSMEEMRKKYPYWLGSQCGERLKAADDKAQGTVRHRLAFRSLAEIAAECGVTAEQIAAMPDARPRQG